MKHKSDILEVAQKLLNQVYFTLFSNIKLKVTLNKVPAFRGELCLSFREEL